MKTRTALLVAVIGVCAFLITEIGKRNLPLQTSGIAVTHLVKHVDGVNKPEPTLVADPAAKQKAIDEELARAVKRTQEVELNRAIQRALSDASQDAPKAWRDQ